MTSLANGQRVEKKCERIEAYGTIDELNSQLGLLITYCTEDYDKGFLTEVQRNLFIVSGWLAGAKTDKVLSTESMEAEIDRLKDVVEEAQEDKRFHFILPGGSRAAAIAHVCRTVCRRAERAMLRVDPLPTSPRGGESLDWMLKYVNRLSDYLFILARKLNVDNNTKDVVLK